jgi:hypothetical protein
MMMRSSRAYASAWWKVARVCKHHGNNSRHAAGPGSLQEELTHSLWRTLKVLLQIALATIAMCLARAVRSPPASAAAANSQEHRS